LKIAPVDMTKVTKVKTNLDLEQERESLVSPRLKAIVRKVKANGDEQISRKYKKAFTKVTTNAIQRYDHMKKKLTALRQA
ncbi:hypothetical protein HK096_006784, partial [Nowakowskiella sp. JEL0078]